MSTIKVLGIDLGKSSFHVIGRDYSDNQVIRKKFSRSALVHYLHQLKPAPLLSKLVAVRIGLAGNVS